MPPRICRWTIRAAARFVPARMRQGWHARWDSGLRNWWMLVERGDVSVRSSGDVCRAALADAWRTRFGRIPFERPFDRLLRAPSTVPVAAGLALLALFTLTSGFAYARSIPAESDRLFGHSLLLSFALVTAAVLVVFRGVGLRGRGWRYWAFLLVKTASVLLVVTFIWIEAGAFLRARIPTRQWSALLGGFFWSVAYIAVFVQSAGWSFADQRRRCPVCLRRLIQPVSIGTWSSMFEPALTELVCEDGHGMLCMADNEGDAEARWTELDASWKGL